MQIRHGLTANQPINGRADIDAGHIVDVIDHLAFHFFCRWLRAQLGECFTQGLGFGTFGQLGIGPLHPHGIRGDAFLLPTLDGIILAPVFARSEIGHMIAAAALDRDPAPLGISDLRPADGFGHVGAKFWLGDAGILARARRLDAVQPDTRHHHIAHLAGLSVPHGDDMDGLLQRVQPGRLTVGQHHPDGLG